MQQAMTSRRRFIKQGVAAGVATLLAPQAFLGCSDAEELVNNINDNNVSLPDLDKLAETLILDDSYLIADPKSGLLYRINQQAHSVAQLNADLSERWSFGGLGSEDDQLNFPTSLWPHSDGSIQIVDSGNGRVVELDAQGKFVRAISPQLDEGASGFVRGAVVDTAGDIWMAIPNQHKIYRFDRQGTLKSSFGEQGQGDGELNSPRSIAFDGDGMLHVVDAGNARVQVFKPDGAFVRSYGGYGQGDGKHIVPRSIAIAQNSLVYVADPIAGAVQVYDKAGKALARLDELTLNQKPAVPLDVSIRPNGLVQVRLYSWDIAA